MANHVSQYLSVKSISEEGLKVWNEILGRLDRDDTAHDHEKHLGFIFFDSYDDMDRTNMCEQVGAKWAYCTDRDDSDLDELMNNA